MEDRVHGTEGFARRGVSVRFRLAAEKAVKQMARWNLIRVSSTTKCNTKREQMN